jgi:hypothetical protein
LPSEVSALPQVEGAASGAGHEVNLHFPLGPVLFWAKIHEASWPLPPAFDEVIAGEYTGLQKVLLPKTKEE